MVIYFYTRFCLKLIKDSVLNYLRSSTEACSGLTRLPRPGVSQKCLEKDLNYNGFHGKTSPVDQQDVSVLVIQPGTQNCNWAVAVEWAGDSAESVCPRCRATGV